MSNVPESTTISCIWCLRADGEPSDEHFWPAALAGDDAAILPTGAVCRACNNALGILDQRSADEFDLFLLGAAVPRRGGKPPVVPNRGNFVGWMEPDGPCIAANLGPGPVNSDGQTIPPAGKSSRNLRPTVESIGNAGRVRLQYEFNFDRGFVRALHKIALEAVCHFHGILRPRDSRYDAIRDFVRWNKGGRHALLLAEPGLSNQFAFDELCVHADGSEIAVIRLGPMRLVVELGPNDLHLKVIRQESEARAIATRIVPARSA